MKWLADENFRNAILRGVVRRSAGIDIIRAQEVPQVSGKDDQHLLAFVTEHERILPTHDVTTMIPAMRRQVLRGGRCAPIVMVPDSLVVQVALEDILLLDECATLRRLGRWGAVSSSSVNPDRRPLRASLNWPFGRMAFHLGHPFYLKGSNLGGWPIDRRERSGTGCSRHVVKREAIPLQD